MLGYHADSPGEHDEEHGHQGSTAPPAEQNLPLRVSPQAGHKNYEDFMKSG
jgi:hypothetical protein